MIDETFRNSKRIQKQKDNCHEYKKIHDIYHAWATWVHFHLKSFIYQYTKKMLYT